ncbi:PREDICTED: mitochondrial inner membrane protease subunit 2 [Tarenaya hassleriana]|uniref:mitochondrial inner membrane protease subunit 2 n=1 Tax=Tarenaya hassleriana TaxID=28532 RepID=UPI00053C0A21|nr:PREDICTED: mitochondrial inner membrane protease subunit 2 [Tarenaya hassleriana]XP_010553101.1 PREDICTED: mitochondrial inner membrane protease subunit 2 [Tarenaya hassleriana]XP_010553102.1 PREDICTED: mitochondrial inner membrane protease subunit 2 [Tarenaya hassleriana]XP_010553103.1 PREDICTED: mitochondrial inner membrane protease subunit 2 [Tarenaya hassleriana]
MGTRNFLWDVAKKSFTGGIIGLTISDRCCSVVPVRGESMSPTFNPQRNSRIDDYVLVEKFCLTNYKFARGDVVVFCSPTHFGERHIKRIVGLPGEWIGTSQDVIKIPEGHCWVEGDNHASSFDSKAFGPIPLGLIQGRVTHVVWPPHRVGKING